MPIPKVVFKLVDLTARVPEFPGVYGVILIDAAMGPLEPQLVTNESELISKYTPYNNILTGYSESYESARAFLTRSNSLWVLRVTGDDPLVGGVVIQSEESDDDNAQFSTGYSNKDSILENEFDAHADSLTAIYASSPGEWSDSFGIRIVNNRSEESLISVDFTPVEYGITGSAGLIEDLTGAESSSTANSISGISVDWYSGVAVSFSGADVADIGLSDSTLYYIGVNSDETISVYLTKSDAIDGTSPVSLLSVSSIGDVTIMEVISESLTALNADGTTDVVESVIGPWETGDSIIATGAGAVTLGLTANTVVYFINRSGDDISFHTTLADAEAGTSKVELTDGVIGPDTTIIKVIRVDVTADTVIIPRPNISTGDRITVSGADTPTGLTSGSSYYVKNISGYEFTLHNTEAEANIVSSTPISLTSTGGSDFSIELSSVLDLEDNSFNLPGNEWSTGEAISIRPKGTAVLPAPLTRDTSYYIIRDVVSTDVRYKLALSRADAIAGTEIDITSQFSGNILINAVDKVELPGATEIRVFHNRQDNFLTPVETWTVSRNPEAKDGNGRNIFIERVLEESLYIRAVEKSIVDPNSLEAGEYPTRLKPTCGNVDNIIYLSGGEVTAPNEADFESAVQTFENPVTYPITVFMDGGYHNTSGTGSYERAIINLCENRGDCVAFLSTPIEYELASDVTPLIDWSSDTLPSTSRGAVYTPHVKVTDPNTGLPKFVSPDGYMAAALSYLAGNSEIWFPLSGETRGLLPQVADVFVRYTEPQADLLHDLGRINPLMFSPGRGVRAVSQRTLYSIPSDQQNLNVILLLTILQPALTKLLEKFLQEVNNEATRIRLKGEIDAYMDNVRSRGGIFAFETVIDTSNNPSSVVNDQKMVVDLFIEPTKGVNRINFTTTLVRTGGISALQVRTA